MYNLTEGHDMDLEYIAGFESGCNFIVREIELYMRHQGDSLLLAQLLAHLKGDRDERDNEKAP